MRTILVLDFVPLKLVAASSPSQVAGQPSSNGGRQGTIRQSWISVCHKTLYQSQLSSLWPHTLYVEVVSAG